MVSDQSFGDGNAVASNDTVRRVDGPKGRGRMLIVASDGMVQITGGMFRMGSDVHYPEKRPAHSVTVGSFQIDRYAVTNADFAAFIGATGYVTFAERPLDPALYLGAKAGLLKPGSAVFRTPGRPVRPRDVHDCGR